MSATPNILRTETSLLVDSSKGPRHVILREMADFVMERHTIESRLQYIENKVTELKQRLRDLDNKG